MPNSHHFAHRLGRRKGMHRLLRMEHLESRRVMAAELGLGLVAEGELTFAPSSFDVNVDGLVSPSDALVVVNHLNLPYNGSGSAESGVRLDVNRDSAISALDALLVINFLNIQPLSASGILIEPSIRIERLPSPSGTFDFRLVGRSAPGAELLVEQLGVGPVGSLIADTQGDWSLTLTNVQLADRKFSFQAKHIDDSGAALVSSEIETFQPNFILVNVDDMVFNQVEHMPFLRDQILPQSTQFENAFVPTALSGPSRASLMTGLYAQRTGILGNGDSLGGGYNEGEHQTFPETLIQEGYQTGLFGKDRTLPALDSQLGDDVAAVPDRWTRYFGVVRAGAQGYGVQYTDQGTIVEYGSDDYGTDRLITTAEQFIAENSAADEPFFAYVAPLFPHAPGSPADRHFGTFEADYIQNPSFNIPTPGRLALPDSTLAELNDYWRSGVESLYAIDEGVESLFDQLDALDELDNTVFVFTSDNGFAYGEHARKGKRSAFNESLRVPLILWDGRLPQTQTSESIALSIDIGPTFVDFAGGTVDPTLDGQSLSPILDDPSATLRDDFAITHWIYDVNFETEPTYLESGVRSNEFLYFTSELDGEFLFDVVNDPFELNNLVDDPAFSTTLATYRQRLDELLVTDRESPAIEVDRILGDTTNWSSPQQVQFDVLVDDSMSGNSTPRTPELVFDYDFPEGLGRPFYEFDGSFDSSTETFRGRLSWNDYFDHGSPRTLWLRGRDEPGNWSQLTEATTEFALQPTLLEEGAFGQAATDHVTLNPFVTFTGRAAPGSSVALFAAPRGNDEFRLLGTAVTDAASDWTVDGVLDAAGEWLVYGQILTETNNQAELIFAAPTSVHLLTTGNSGDSVITIVGSKEDDAIRVQSNANVSELFLNGISVGQVSNPNVFRIQGLAGNDSIIVDGGVRSILFGGNGDDHLGGGTGNDILNGGHGNNYLAGGLGRDQYRFSNSRLIAWLEHETANIIDDSDAFNSIRIEQFDPVMVQSLSNPTQPVAKIETRVRTTKTFEFHPDTSSSQFTEFTTGHGNDQLVISKNHSVDPGSGDDHLTVYDGITPGQQTLLDMFAVGLQLPTGSNITSRLSIPVGSLSLVESDLESVVVSGQNSSLLTLNGTLSAVNSILQSGILVSMPNGLSEAITLTLSTTSLDGSSETDSYVIPVSYRPRFADFPSEVEYLENSPAVRVLPVGRIADRDQNYAGSQLQVWISRNLTDQDRIELISQGDPFEVIGSAIFVDGFLIGNIVSRDSSKDPLTIHFTEHATQAVVTKTLRQIAFRTLSDAPKLPPREVTIIFADGAGASTEPSTVPIVINDQNDAPTLIHDGKIEYGISQRSFKLLRGTPFVNDPDGDFSTNTLSVAVRDSLTMEEELAIIPFVSGIGSVQLEEDRVLVDGLTVGSVSGDGSTSNPLLISWNRYADRLSIQAVIRRIAYRKNTATPPASARSIDFELMDADGLSSEVQSFDVEFVA